MPPWQTIAQLPTSDRQGGGGDQASEAAPAGYLTGQEAAAGGKGGVVDVGADQATELGVDLRRRRRIATDGLDVGVVVHVQRQTAGGDVELLVGGGDEHGAPVVDHMGHRVVDDRPLDLAVGGLD